MTRRYRTYRSHIGMKEHANGGSAAWSGELVISEDLSTDPKWTPVREFAASCQLAYWER